MAAISQIRALRTMADCESCKLRGQPCVPGYGLTNHPDIAFIAETPGETEVEEGKPLVGKAGQFLRKIIHDIGIDENRCYFTNTCICRPPQNKKPTANMIKACRKRLIKEIAMVQPKLVVALGGVPTSGFLGIKRGITRCHGEYKVLKFKSGLSIGALATYHPSGVLRGPDFFIDFYEELYKANQILKGAKPVVPPPYENYKFITKQRDLNEFLVQLSKQKIAACDIETDLMDWSAGKIICIGFSWERERATVIDWIALMADNLKNIRSLDEALKNVKLSFHNGMYDVPFLRHYGMTNINYYFDTMLAHYLIDERQHTHSLERLATRYYDAPPYKTHFRESLGIRGFVSDESWAAAMDKVPKDQLFRYNGADTDYTFRLTQDLAMACKKDGQIKVLKDIEMPAARMFMEFSMDGMLVDQPYWRHMASGWKKEMQTLEDEMRKFPGAEELKFGSTKKLTTYLYDELKLLPFGGKKSFGKKKIDEEDISAAILKVNDPEAREYWTSKRTQMSEGLKGFGGEAKGLSPRSTTTYMLYFLKQQHPFPGILIKWRHIKKRYSMYYTGIKKFIRKDGRIHPEYDMTATRTGRKATKKPAIHNLPRGDEIYNIYISDPGWVNIHADYKTAEMRMMAHYSEDKHLLNIIDTMDIHSVYAMEMFDLTQEKWDKLDKTAVKNMRIASKMVTFGIPYGRSFPVDSVVLTSDLRWVKAGSVKEGDKLLAFSEYGRKEMGGKRQWKITTVKAAVLDSAPIVRNHLSDGSYIDSTDNHLWLARPGISNSVVKWIRADELTIGLASVPKLLNTWSTDTSFEAGYLAGFFDGEGHLANKWTLGFTQQEGLAQKYTESCLDTLGFVWNKRLHDKTSSILKSTFVRGGAPQTLEFLGRVRPVRLLNKLEEHLTTEPHKLRLFPAKWLTIVRREVLNSRPIIHIATKSHTLFVDGFPTHNSAAGLAPQLGKTKEECEEYIELFYSKFAPRLKEWLLEVRAQGVHDHVVRGVLGRKRRFPFIRDRYHQREVERQIGNFTIQTTINDLTMLAQINSIKRLRTAGIPARPWPHIHDSFNILVPTPLWKPAVQIINDTMEEIPFETDVSFPAEIEVGTRWGDMRVVMDKGEWVKEEKKAEVEVNPYGSAEE